MPLEWEVNLLKRNQDKEMRVKGGGVCTHTLHISLGPRGSMHL